MEFLSLSRRRSFARETFPAAKSEEKLMFSQARLGYIRDIETQMATRNAKRSISTILRKSKGLWTV